MLSITKIFKQAIQYFKCETKPVGSGNISSPSSRRTCKQDFLTLQSLQWSFTVVLIPIVPRALIQQRCKANTPDLGGLLRCPKFSLFLLTCRATTQVNKLGFPIGIPKQLLSSPALPWVLASILIFIQLQHGLFLQNSTCFTLIPAKMFPTLIEGQLNKRGSILEIQICIRSTFLSKQKEDLVEDVQLFPFQYSTY